MQSNDYLFTDAERDQLIELAWDSVRYGLRSGTAQPVDRDAFQSELLQNLASFVSLHRHGNLRGCIGTLEAYRPLVEDVSANAYAAAFLDPRFESLQEHELGGLDLKISVLTPQEPMSVATEQDLLSQIRPGTDGIVLELGVRKATFLPAVWEQLPDPVDFLYELKRKAGLDPVGWEPGIQVFRYTTVEF